MQSATKGLNFGAQSGDDIHKNLGEKLAKSLVKVLKLMITTTAHQHQNYD